MRILKLTKSFPWGRFLVCLFWILGLIFGCYLAAAAPAEEISFVSQISQHQLSIVGLFISLMIPLVLSYLAFKLRLQFIVLPIAFVKAVCFSFCALCLVFTFGDAGWLLYRFYIFSDSCSVIVLIWFWNRYIAEGAVNLKGSFYYCLIAISSACFIDFILVSPFVMMLFN